MFSFHIYTKLKMEDISWREIKSKHGRMIYFKFEEFLNPQIGVSNIIAIQAPFLQLSTGRFSKPIQWIQLFSSPRDVKDMKFDIIYLVISFYKKINIEFFHKNCIKNYKKIKMDGSSSGVWGRIKDWSKTKIEIPCVER